MRKSFKYFSLAVGISILIFGILIFFKPSFCFEFVNPIEYKLLNVNTEINDEEILLDFDVELTNGYFLDLVIDSLSYDIYFDSVKFSKGNKTLTNVFVNKKDIDTVNLPLAIDLEALKGKLKDVKEKDSTTLIIAFTNYGDLPLTGKSSFNFNIEKKIASPKPPEVTVLDIQKNILKLRKANYTIFFEIYNPNNYALKIQSINSTILFDDLFSGDAESNKSFEILPKESTYFDADIEMKDLQLVKDGFKILFQPKKEWTCHINADIKILKKDSSTTKVRIKTTNQVRILGRNNNNE